MKFFVPQAQNEAQSEQVWNQVKAFIQKTTNYPAITERRVYQLEYTEGGKPRRATVGEGDVLVILEVEPPGLYLICTPDQGVLYGEPHMVDRDRVQSVGYFEGAPTV